MNRIFICSPLRGSEQRTQRENEKLAEQLSRGVLDLGGAPFAPHLLFTRFTDENNERDRAAGIAAGLKFMETCAALYIYTQQGVSAGMTVEITHARKRGVPIHAVIFDGAGRLVVGARWENPPVEKTP